MSLEITPSQQEVNFTMNHENINLSEKMDTLFEKNYALAREFAQNPQLFFDNLVAIDPEAAARCFNTTELEVCCIDGRLTQGNLAIAGSGCLYEQPSEALNFAKQTALNNGAQIVGITSHEHCGAAGMKQIDAQQHSETLSQQVNIPFMGHLSVDLPEFHDEVAAYYSGTNSLGLQHLKGLPRGFRLSRRYYPSADAAVFEAEVAINIAFGDHGLGNRFTPENPFIIVALGDGSDPQFSAERLAQELSGLASDRIKIVQVNYHRAISSQETPLAA